MSHRRSAFSLIEMVVAIAILVVLGSALVPSTVQYLQQKNVANTASRLDSLAVDIIQFKLAVTQYPGRLRQLSQPIVNADSTACNGVSPTTTVLFGGNSTRWTGPYSKQRFAPTGLPLGIGVANDQLTRSSNNTTPGFIKITIPLVDFVDAKALNDYMDGQGDVNQANRSNTTGAIQWGVPNASDQVTLTFGVGANRTC